MINGVSYKELGAIFEAVFNVRPAFNIPAKQNQQQSSIKYPEVKANTVLDRELSAQTSWMGTPIIFPFTIGGEKLKVFDVDGSLREKEFAAFEMPAATLIDASREKEIVRTKVASGYGTVKELFSVGDWSIKIRGLCLNEPDKSGGYIRTSLEQKEALMQYEAVVGSIAVTSWLFQDMGISRIIISDMTFRQVEGKPWVIPFEMTAESDVDPVLTINKPGSGLRRVM